MIGFIELSRLVRRSKVPYEVPGELVSSHRDLYEAKVEPTADGARFHRARLWRREGINVLHLVGDRFEMAFQHGRLLQKEIADGTLEMCGKIAEHGIRNSMGDGAVAQVVQWYCEKMLAEAMLEHGVAWSHGRGENSLDEGYGLAEGANIPTRTVFHAPLGPEVAQLLLGRTSGLALGADPNQCSSFVAWGDKTKTGEMIIGRNTDYPLTGYFDKHPTVIYFEPTDGAQRFMCVTSAGAHNAATGGMNESGLYVAMHTVPAQSVSERGFPVMMVAQRILRDAKTIEEAREIVDTAKPAAGWCFHVVSVNEKRAATFEMCSEQTGVVYSSGTTHVTTNHYRTPEMQQHQLFVNNSVEVDTRARMHACETQVEAGGLDARSAAAILADKVDHTVGKVRSGPNTVSASTTVSSSVWMPESGRVFVANGPAPVSQNTYVELPSIQAFDPDTFEGSYETFTAGVRDTHPEMLASEQAYQRARVAFEYDDDAELALDHMAEALELDDENPALHLHHALYALRASRYFVAKKAAEEILRIGWDEQRNRVARYLLGRIAAHDGELDVAKQHLDAVASDSETGRRLASAAKKAAAKVARGKRLPLGPRDIAPMSWMPDAFRYAGLFG